MAGEVTQERSAITILWRIENLSLWEEPSIGIYTVFAVDILDESRWYLCLHSRGLNKNDKHLRLQLGSITIQQFRYPMSLECSILDSGGAPLISGTLRDHFIQGNASIDLPVCPSQKEEYETKKNSYLPNDTLSMRCRIWKSEDSINVENLSLLTRIEVRETSFVWPVTNFSSIEINQKVTAPEDLHPQLPGISLGLVLDGRHISNSWIEFETEAPRRDHKSLLKLKVSLLHPAPKEIEIINGKHTLEAYETLWTVPAFFSRAELLEKKNGCLVNDVLTLACKIVYIYNENANTKICNEPSGTNNEIRRRTFRRINTRPMLIRHVRQKKNVGQVCQTLEQKDNPPEKSKGTNESLDILSADLLYLYKEQTFSDFELRSNDVSFPVHKNVLIARSSVFRAMLSSGMEESKSNFLDVPDVDSHTLNQLLTFLYTGTVDPMQWELAAKLYYAADKYQVSSLKQICRSTLWSNIAMPNICEILILADRHQDQELISNVHNFILDDFDEIMQSKEWQIFMEKDPSFAGKTTHQILMKKYRLSKKEDSS